MSMQQQSAITEFLSPVGRMVGGDLFEVADNSGFGNGQPQRTQAGEEKEQYIVVMAIPKVVNGQQNQEFATFWNKLYQVGLAAFPHLGQIPPFYDPQCRFAWKIQDGDGYDGNGRPNAQKAGYAGHWIVKFASKFAPKTFYVGRHAPQDQITDPNVVPLGHYIRVAGTTQGNKQQQKPGIYLNVSLVEYIGGTKDDVIVRGPSAASAFATAPVLPAGLQAVMPGAPAGGLPPLNAAPAAPVGIPAQPQPLGVPPMQQAPVGLPALAPAAAPAGVPAIPGYSAPTMSAPGIPAPGVTPPSIPSPGSLPVQPNPGILAGPAPAAAPVMTALAGAYTYDQYKQAGYTDDMLRQQGLMQ